jgi:hypothetical protein
MKLTGPQATILAALIAVLGIVVGAFLKPFATKLINQPEPTPNSAFQAIEELPVSVFVYDGSGEKLGGWAGLGISYLNSTPNYQFSYYVPKDQTGYAGIAFRFSEGENLSKYQHVEFTIQFDDKESEHVIDFYLTDISGQKDYVRVTEIGSDKKSESQLLSKFANVNLNAIKEIKFNTGNTFVTGDHHTTISGIRFVQ